MYIKVLDIEKHHWKAEEFVKHSEKEGRGKKCVERKAKWRKDFTGKET